MKHKGTQGNWIFLKETEAEFFRLSISDEKGNWIFNTEMKTWIDEEIEANFKLVSKAPEMLTCLISCYHIVENAGYTALLNKMKRVLTEATEL